MAMRIKNAATQINAFGGIKELLSINRIHTSKCGKIMVICCAYLWLQLPLTQCLCVIEQSVQI